MMFRSSVTGKMYKVIGSGDWSCSTLNVVNLVTCQCCGLQYVGKTSHAFRKRINNHNIKSLKPQFVYNRFVSDGHTLGDKFVQPIENIVVAPNGSGSEQDSHCQAPMRPSPSQGCAQNRYKKPALLRSEARRNTNSSSTIQFVAINHQEHYALESNHQGISEDQLLEPQFY